MVENKVMTSSIGNSTPDQQRAFVLNVVQPGPAGLSGGYVSDINPLIK